MCESALVADSAADYSAQQSQRKILQNVLLNHTANTDDP